MRLITFSAADDAQGGNIEIGVGQLQLLLSSLEGWGRLETGLAE